MSEILTYKFSKSAGTPQQATAPGVGSGIILMPTDLATWSRMTGIQIDPDAWRKMKERETMVRELTRPIRPGEGLRMAKAMENRVPVMRTYTPGRNERPIGKNWDRNADLRQALAKSQAKSQNTGSAWNWDWLKFPTNGGNYVSYDSAAPGTLGVPGNNNVGEDLITKTTASETPEQAEQRKDAEGKWLADIPIKALTPIISDPHSKLKNNSDELNTYRESAVYHLLRNMGKGIGSPDWSESSAIYLTYLADHPEEADAFKRALFESKEYKNLSAEDRLKFFKHMTTDLSKQLYGDKGLPAHKNALRGVVLSWRSRNDGSGYTPGQIQNKYSEYIGGRLTPIFTDIVKQGATDLGQNRESYESIHNEAVLNSIADSAVAELEKARIDPKYNPNPYIMARAAIIYKQYPKAAEIINSKVGGFLTEDPATIQDKINFFERFNPSLDTKNFTQEQQLQLLLASGGNRSLLNEKELGSYGTDVANTFKSGLSEVMPGFITSKFANDPKFRNHFVTDDYRTNIMNTTLGQFNGYLSKDKDFKWNYNNLIAHTALYNNDPKYRQMFDDKFGSYIGGRIGPNTTPQQLQELYDRLNSVSFDEAEMDKTVQGLKSNPASSMPILAAMHGNMNPDVESMKNTVMAGHRAAGTNAAMASFKNHGLFWKNPREWVVFAHRNKIGNVPDWFGNLAQNRELFWGTIIGGGTLAVGGLAMLVSSFLNRKKDEEEEEEGLSSEYGNGRQRQRKPYIPNTTSMWRAGTNAY